MKGYFGIGVEHLSKPGNLANLFRTAHGFGAGFLFTIGANPPVREAAADTSRASEHVPLYHWDSAADVKLPKGCALVGVELTDEAVELPSFRHPQRAAYVLGPERGQLSAELLALCDHVVRIPTRFSLNVATAGAILMYDRLTALGRFASRPVTPRGRPAPLKPHVHGEPLIRSERED